MNHHDTRRHPLATLALLMLAAAMTLTACTADGGIDAQQVEQHRQNVQQAVDAGKQTLGTLEQQLAALPPEQQDSAEAIKLRETIASLQAKVDAGAAAIDSLAQALSSNPDDPTATGAAVGQAVAPFLPPPWNLALMLGLPLAGSLVQLVRKSREASARAEAAKAAQAQTERIVTAIEAVKSGTGEVKFKDTQTKKALDTLLTEDDKRLVDGVQRNAA